MQPCSSGIRSSTASPKRKSKNITDDPDQPLDTGEAAQQEIGASGTPVRKVGRITREQYLRKQPIPTKGDNIITTLDFNEWVYVDAKGGAEDGWYQIVSQSGQQGWIPAAAAALDPPEPDALLYEVQSSDTPLSLAASWYKPDDGFSHAWDPFSDDPGDARFYVTALAFANKGRAGMSSPDDLTSVNAWRSVELIAGDHIWKPSKELLDSFKGQVSSASLIKTGLDAAVDIVIGYSAFHGGLLYGALESIYDLFAGVVDLAVMVVDILKSIFSGNVLQDAKELWENLKTLSLDDLTGELERQWNAESVAERWFFRGRVVGYVIMEIALWYFSAGIAAAVKWAGKFGKLAKTLAKLPKVTKVSEKMAKASKMARLPEKAVQLIKLKLTGKGAKILQGIDKAMESVEVYLKSTEHLQKRAAAWIKYQQRGGAKSKDVWEAMYDRLTRNRIKGGIAEEQFAKVMDGMPESFKVKVGGKKVVREVDNVLGNVAREIKSGPLKLNDFIKKQILKDIQLMKSKGMKVEWHLLAGGDSKAIAALKKANIDVIIY